MQNWYWVVLGCFITAGVMALGHYLPRPAEVETDERGHMLINTKELLGRYAFGVGTLAIGFCIIQLGQGDYAQIVELLAVVAAGGLVVLLLYAWDRWVNSQRRLRKYKAMDDER